MLAPQTPFYWIKRTPRKAWFPRLGFSLRLNLYYAAFFFIGAFFLFLLAYVLLIRELRQGDREIVRAKVEACKAWYTQGGHGRGRG